MQRGAGGRAGVLAAGEQEEEPPPRQGQPESRGGRPSQVRASVPPPPGFRRPGRPAPGRQGRGRGRRGRGLAEETEAGGKSPRLAALAPGGVSGVRSPDLLVEKGPGSPYF